MRITLFLITKNMWFQMKYFMDIEILYEKFFIIFNNCPVSNNNVNTAEIWII